MLYDILPPLIFFSSLGGIIVVVSRVVARARREQFVLSLKNQAASVDDSALSQSNSLASLIGPAGKGMKFFSNPFSLAKSVLSSTITGSKEAVQHRRRQFSAWREKRGEDKDSKPVASAGMSEKEAPDAIKPPSSRFRNFAGSIKASVADKTASAVGSARTAQKSFMERNKKAISKIRREEDSLPRAADSKRSEFKTASDQTSSTLDKRRLRLSKKEAAPLSEPDKSTLSSAEVSKDSSSSPIQLEKEQNKRISRLFAKEKSAPHSILEQARGALESAQLELVEELLIPYVMKNPRDAKAYMMLGEVAASRGEWEDAVQAFQHVISLNPNLSGSYAALGHATFKAGHMTKAIEHLQKAHNNDPANRQVIEELLIIARNMDNVPLQKSLIAELAEMEPR